MTSGEAMNSYLTSIITACTLFPLVAAVFTMPFVIVHYRKYGGIPVIRVMVVYSFILYSMCALFLTVLPLPSINAVEAMKPKPVGLIPGKDLYQTLIDAGFSFKDLSTFGNFRCWKIMFGSFGFFQIAANIIMQVPLGIYLRYYFRLDWKKTLLAGFFVSLFYELTQLTGLWFIYPKAYRYAEVDDLINNTLGCMIGYWITPLFQMFLPKRDEIDQMSYTKGLYVTLIRRFFACFFDLVFFGIINALFVYFHQPSFNGKLYNLLWFCVFILLFGLLPVLCKGSTPGQLLVRLRVKNEDWVKDATFLQHLLRNTLLYVLETGMVGLSGAFLGFAVYLLAGNAQTPFPRLLVILVTVGIPVLFFWWCAHCSRKYHTLPHSHYSRTSLVPIPVSVRIRNRDDRNENN